MNDYFEFYYCAFIIIYITIIWSRKYCYNNWKFLSAVPFVHFIAIKLRFVCSQYRQEFILMQKLIRSSLSKEVRAPSDIILNELLRAWTLFILNWIRPKNITKETNSWWLLKPLQILQIINRLQFRRYATVKGKEFIIDETRYGKGIKCLHKQFISLLVVLIETLCTKVEELRHLATLVISSQHVDRRRIVQLQRIE